METFYPPSGFHRHDHDACIEAVMEAVEARIAARKLRMTPVRRRVLEMLLESHRAMGAYDVLARLKEEGLGYQPPIAYRALDFLVRHGFAHRIEKLNAFVACARPDCADPAFLICRSCAAVSEADAPAGLDRTARLEGFAVERAIVEAEGLCPACRREGT
ncbi:transcriptional repressor [Jannaschia sp. Os4]|uniref:Fur family transcriptional regulator n=1 Tax=Jannaschia sp. Os4 TaxID=2807617 RepID=UPI00193946AF|nr:Fur family transcriptional regulator [Jannaschia sp. Os4]MBM2575884.1 transcriptional repressor [Jannaschia sp. Os4]